MPLTVEQWHQLHQGLALDPSVLVDDEAFAEDVMNQLLEYSHVAEVGDALVEYERFLNVFPDDVPCKRKLCRDFVLMVLDTEDSSLCYRTVTRCLRMFPEDALLLETWEGIVNELVARWHFRMLNDDVRNQTYMKAIHAAVTRFVRNNTDPDRCCNVLDIGTGSGLLSLMVAQVFVQLKQSSELSCARGVLPKHVDIWACEGSKVMAEVASRVVVGNGFGGDHAFVTISVLHCLSTDLDTFRVPKADIIVSEILDAGLLGEHVVPTLVHAQEHLLVPDTGVMIPTSADVFFCGIESDSLCGLKDTQLGDKTLKLNEPYTCDRLDRFAHKRLTDAVLLEHVPFGLRGGGSLCTPSTINLPCIADGRLDGFALWFQLHLDGTNSFSTVPSMYANAPSQCLPVPIADWDQALFVVSGGVRVREQDQLPVQAQRFDSEYRLAVSRTPETSVQDLQAELSRCRSDMTDLQSQLALLATEFKKSVVEVAAVAQMQRGSGDQSDVKSALVKRFESMFPVSPPAPPHKQPPGPGDLLLVDDVVLRSYNAPASKHTRDVFDVLSSANKVSPGIPNALVVGGTVFLVDVLQYMLQVARTGQVPWGHHNWTVVHSGLENSDKEVSDATMVVRKLVGLLEGLNVPVELHEDTMMNVVQSHVQYGRDMAWGTGKQADVLFVQIVDTSGLMRRGVVPEILFMRQFLQADGGLVFPRKLVCWAVPVQSDHLDELNYLHHEPVKGLDVGLVNEFSVVMFQEVENRLVANASVVELGPTFVALELDFDEFLAGVEDVNSVILDDHYVSGGCAGYEFSVSGHRVDAMLFHFEVFGDGGLRSTPFSESGNLYNRAAFMLPLNRRFVCEQGDKVDIHARLHCATGRMGFALSVTGS